MDDSRRDARPYFSKIGLGFAKMKTNQFAQAVPDLDKGLEILPNHLSGLSARAFALEKLGDRKRALEDYDRILNLKPDDDWAVERRVRLQVR
jgi:Tfp pilus assembly protein PilF